MTSREQFETWWKTQRAVCQFAREGSKNGAYHSKPCQSAWEAWQASRDAVEVQLPDRRDYEETLSDHELGFNIALELCAEAIRAAGIKVIEGEKKNG